MQTQRVEQALAELKNGKMIILTDNPERENEGDLIIPAEMITPDIMNFMIRNGTGIVCISMHKQRLDELNLPLMVAHDDNASANSTQFTISVDAKNNISTGVSAADRAETIKVLVDENTTAADIVMPGHIFPLQAKDGGVFERCGHTEGALDLVKIGGFKPAAVICEIMNPDGTMARGQQLTKFAEQHNLFMLAIDDIITYRLSHENRIKSEATCQLPLGPYGQFKMTVLREELSGNEHVVLAKEIKNKSRPTLVRMHSSCLTGDLFGSKRCDCHNQLHHSLQRISEEGGILIYMNQEGRGIGLFDKIRTYALQEQGYDTVEANVKLGLPIDSRQYHIAANILRNMQVSEIRLLTNNPSKINDLKKYGVKHIEREAMPAFENSHNQHYLRTKQAKLNHDINFDLIQFALKSTGTN